MFRKSVILLLASIIIISGQMGFASTNHPVDADQILIVEQTSEIITNDKQVIVAVNITNSKVLDNPIIVSLVRIENRLPFEDKLGSDLKVSVMKLSSSAGGELDKSVTFNINYDTDSKGYSENLDKETKVINRFFELKDAILNHNFEISTINKKYRFDLIASNSDEISKLGSDAHEAYKRWSQLKTSVIELKKEFTQVQVQYLKYFEKQLVVDKIDTLSYFKMVGKLSNGLYKLRFIDEDGQLIKVFTFEVVDREEPVKLIESMTKTN